MMRENLITDIKGLGVECEVSTIYGKGTVLKLDVSPAYYLYTTVSNIYPGFFNVTENVIYGLDRDGVDYALVFLGVDNQGEDVVYIYDKQQTKELLNNSSVEKKSGNYRLTSDQLSNPIKNSTFIEFIDSLI